MSATTTLIGNTTSDVEIRKTQSNKSVGNVTIAVTERRFDKTKNEYVDGSTWFARCILWGEIAENASVSIPKGTRVIAAGRIGQSDWEDKDGAKRTSVEVTVDDIGASLRFATAQVTRSQSNNDRSSSQPVDSWAATTPGGDNWNSSVGSTEEKPF